MYICLMPRKRRCQGTRWDMFGGAINREGVVESQLSCAVRGFGRYTNNVMGRAMTCNILSE